MGCLGTEVLVATIGRTMSPTAPPLAKGRLRGVESSDLGTAVLWQWGQGGFVEVVMALKGSLCL